MSNILSRIRTICTLVALVIPAMCGQNVSAAESAAPADTPVKKHYIVFHDDRQNIIKRVEASGDYTFNADEPFFFVTLPVSNTAWSTEYTTVEQSESAGGIIGGEGVYTFASGEKLSKYHLNPLAEDLHVYPVVRYGTYIRFDSQGGTPVPFQFLHAGETMSQPTGLTKRGYRLEGWYTSTEYTQKFDFTWSPSAGDNPREKIAYAKWEPITSRYTIQVWLEKAEHPYRANLEEAKAHMFEDYAYGTSITKADGVITGGKVSFTNDDKSNDAVIDATNLGVSHSAVDKFPVFFYDNANYSYAQALTEDCISEINDGAGVAPDGTTVLNVFYRRIVFETTLGVLNNTSYYDGKTDPDFDESYNHPTILVRDGQSIGSAIQREINAKRLSLNSATNDLFHYVTCVADSPYYGFYKLTGYDGYTCGFNTHYAFGLWDEILNANDLYLLQNYKITGTAPSKYNIVTDKFTLYAVIAKEKKGDYEFHRRFYFQTVTAAKNNATDVRDSGKGAIISPNVNYYNDETYITFKTATTSGFSIDDVDGFTFSETQDVKRNVDGSINTVKFAKSGKTGTYQNYRPAGYELEVFYKRNSYNVEFTSAPGPDVDDATKSYSVYYHDNLSEVSPTTGGNAFEAGVTWYEDSQHIRYKFAGWYDNAAGDGSPVNFSTFEMPSHNVHLYAKWEVQDIIVTFDAGDGTVGPAHSPAVAFSMSSGTIPANPGDAEPLDQSGHVYFFAWLKGGVIYDFSERLYEDTTLEALYYVDPVSPFKITYKSGKGTGEDVVEFADYGYLYNANAGVQGYDYADYFGSWTLPEGKVFKHWKADDSAQTVYDTNADPNLEVIVNRSVVLTAIYEGGHADIVINREDLLPGESATYTVSKMNGDEKTYVLTVVVTGNIAGTTASRKIVNVEPGEYFVEETEWSWAYGRGDTTVKEWEKSAQTSATAGQGSGSVNYEETLVFTFTGDPAENVAKHGEAIEYNEFGDTSSDNETPDGGLDI